MLKGFDCLRFDHQQKQKMFSIPKMSRVALASMQPPTQFIPRAQSITAKQLGHEAIHLPPSHFNIKNEWSYTSTPSICCHGTDRGDFTFNLYPFTLHTVTTGNRQGLGKQRVSVQSDFSLGTRR